MTSANENVSKKSSPSEGHLPSFTLKLFFWILLGMLSMFFAEVITGSTLFPFINPFEPLTILISTLFIFPVYFLHTLVLATVVFRYGKPWFYALYAAGMLFGMYEAYMTKVLWSGWGEAPSAGTIGGVGTVELLFLVLFIHAILSFVLPLLVGESILTKSRTIAQGFPPWIRTLAASKVFWTLGILFLSLFHTLNSPTPLHSFLSAVLSLGVIALFVHLWRKRSHGLSFDFASLLPTPRQFKILAMFLLADYLFLGFMLEPQKFPSGLLPQLSIWVIYVVLLLIFIRTLKLSKVQKMTASAKTTINPWKKFLLFIPIFAVLTTALELFTAPLFTIIWLVMTFTIIGAGLILFGTTLWNLRRKASSEIKR